MTCDDVFDLLTLQHGAGDSQRREAVERHLKNCRSCRRLADALEPAVELFRECAASDDRSAAALLPGPWSEAEASSRAAGIASLPEPHRAASRGDWSVLSTAGPSSTPWMWQLFGGDLMRLAAALLVGLTLGALVWGPSNEPAATTAGPGPSAPRVTLAALRLTAECVPAEHRAASADSGPRLRPASELVAANQLGSLVCCTLCHASGMATSKSATLEVVRSCQACHTF
jgi:hypothetical protein